MLSWIYIIVANVLWCFISIVCGKECGQVRLVLRRNKCNRKYWILPSLEMVIPCFRSYCCIPEFTLPSVPVPLNVSFPFLPAPPSALTHLCSFMSQEDWIFRGGGKKPKTNKKTQRSLLMAPLQSFHCMTLLEVASSKKVHSHSSTLYLSRGVCYCIVLTTLSVWRSL